MASKPQTFAEALSHVQSEKRASDLANLANAYLSLSQAIAEAQSLQKEIETAAADPNTPLETITKLYKRAHQAGRNI